TLDLSSADIDLDADPAELGVDAFAATEIASRLVPAGQEGGVAQLFGRERSLRALAARLPRNNETAVVEGPALADIAFTLAAGREEFDERLALVVDNVTDLIARLHAFAATGTETYRASRSSG